jgi:hypothetical protein
MLPNHLSDGSDEEYMPSAASLASGSDAELEMNDGMDLDVDISVLKPMSLLLGHPNSSLIYPFQKKTSEESKAVRSRNRERELVSDTPCLHRRTTDTSLRESVKNSSKKQLSTGALAQRQDWWD